MQGLNLTIWAMNLSSLQKDKISISSEDLRPSRLCNQKFGTDDGLLAYFQMIDVSTSGLLWWFDEANQVKKFKNLWSYVECMKISWRLKNLV